MILLTKDETLTIQLSEDKTLKVQQSHISFTSLVLLISYFIIDIG